MRKAAIERGDLMEERMWYPLPALALTWGYVLEKLTFTDTWIKYAVSLIGTLLLCASFYQMRKINHEFEKTWLLMEILLISRIISLIGITAGFPQSFSTDLNFEMKAGGGILDIALLICFRRALILYEETWRDFGKKDPLLWLIVLNAAGLLPGIIFMIMGCPREIQASEDIFSLIAEYFAILPMLLILILISCAGLFYKTVKSINTLKPNVIFFTEKKKSRELAYAYLGLCVAVVIVTSVGAGHPYMGFREKDSYSTDEQEDGLDTALAQIGITNLMQEDLPRDYLEESKEADNALENTFRLNFNRGGEMISNTIYTEFSDDVVYVLEYFAWQDNAPIWNCSIALGSNCKMEFVEGRLLCSKNGKVMETVLEDFIKKDGQTESIYDDKYAIAKRICYPIGSVQRRGYIIYRTKVSDQELDGYVWDGYGTGTQKEVYNKFYFVHKPYPYVQIPYQNAYQQITAGRRGEHGSHYRLGGEFQW